MLLQLTVYPISAFGTGKYTCFQTAAQSRRTFFHSQIQIKGRKEIVAGNGE